MQRREDAIRSEAFRRLRNETRQIVRAQAIAAALADGQNRVVVRHEGAQRNGPCPCGSGKKFKRCCRTVRT